MFIKLHSAAVVGLTCVPVEVEIDIQKGQTNFSIVGLADTAIKEAKDRIYSAIKNSGFTYPFNFRIVVNLAPADIEKEGASYDLPMAVGIIAASEKLMFNAGRVLVAGELALDGTVRHIPGVLSLALYAREHKFKSIFVPAMDAYEASAVEGVTVYPVENLAQVVAHLSAGAQLAPFARPLDALEASEPAVFESDFALIKGQEFVKRALEIAAAGAHNVLMSGPPGAGKTLLARAVPSILPPLTHDEVLEVTKIYSVAGLLNGGLKTERPFRSPHHTASAVALVGGGRVPRPGEITLAHRGVLFLDELPEFPRFVIESLRQPLEDGVIAVARANGSSLFPARFMLLASQNPCPCGYATDPEQACICTPVALVRYHKKVSGPMLDRIDLHVEVPRVETNKLSGKELAESSGAVRKRVVAARSIQQKRFAETTIHTNSEMGAKQLRKFCKLAAAGEQLLARAISQLHLSARGYTRILKVARTIADLAGSKSIRESHLAEALQYRAKID